MNEPYTIRKINICQCLGNWILIRFILYISILDYRFFFGNIWKILNFWLNGIQKARFFSIFAESSSKKELTNNKKLNNITKQISYTFKFSIFSSINIGLLLIINIAYFGNLYKLKQHLSQLKQEAIFLKNPIHKPIVPQLWLNDNEIIWDVGLGCERERVDQGRSYVDESISISLCFFSRYLAFSGDGGVIMVSYGCSCSVNINYSMFYNCVCSSNGGAIYFNSHIIYIRMICASSCNGNEKHFAYLYTSQVNQVEYLSVSNCSHATSGYSSIYLQRGNQSIDNTNSSMNNANQGPGVVIDYPSSFTSSHCTFSNNKVSGSMCIPIYSPTGAVSMSYANIVHNNSPGFGIIYLYGSGSKKMMYCIFRNNQNYLFYVFSGSLEVSHSFIDHSEYFSSKVAVSTSTNNSFTYRITYQLQFFKSYYCNAELPAPVPSPMCTPTFAPTKTFERSPIRSIEETKRKTNAKTLSRTYERTIGQTIRETLMNTPDHTPINTPKATLMITPDVTPMYTPEETLMYTPEETPMGNPKKTSMYTPEETPMTTPEETLMNTPIETPIKSSRANSFRLVLISLSVIVLLISVIYAIGLIIHYEQESSNMSSSKSDENLLETV